MITPTFLMTWGQRNTRRRALRWRPSTCHRTLGSPAPPGTLAAGAAGVLLSSGLRSGRADACRHDPAAMRHRARARPRRGARHRGRRLRRTSRPSSLAPSATPCRRHRPSPPRPRPPTTPMRRASTAGAGGQTVEPGSVGPHDPTTQTDWGVILDDLPPTSRCTRARRSPRSPDELVSGAFEAPADRGRASRAGTPTPLTERGYASRHRHPLEDGSQVMDSRRTCRSAGSRSRSGRRRTTIDRSSTVARHG